MNELRIQLLLVIGGLSFLLLIVSVIFITSHFLNVLTHAAFVPNFKDSFSRDLAMAGFLSIALATGLLGWRAGDLLFGKYLSR